MTNVLIYVIDALRADHVGCYGYQRPTTPHLDALAAEATAVRFTRAFTPSTWTKPVAASILSGCYPPAHGVRTRRDLFLRAVPRLPELLGSMGYRTMAVSTIGNVSSSLGFAIGFDQFVDLYKDPDLASRREVSNTGVWKLYFEQDTTVVLPLAEDVNQVALRWLSQHGDRPWFLFLWVLDPHDPYYPPDGFDRWRDPSYRGRIDGSAESVRRVRSEADRQRLIDLYDGEIAYTDEQFGRLVDWLRQQGLYDDTLIVVAGDHGEAFGEHGDFVHGHLAYEEIMHVPLIIRFPSGMALALPKRTRQAKSVSGASRPSTPPPGSPATPDTAKPTRSEGRPGPSLSKESAGLVCDALTQLTDIAPTILDALGQGSLGQGMQGYSLLPVLREKLPPRQAVYAETQASAANNRLLAARNGRWKYLRVDPPGDYSTATEKATALQVGWKQRLAGYWQQLRNPEMLRKLLRNPMFYVRRQLAAREMLFDLEADPGEQRNLIRQYPEIAAQMRAALDAWLAECRVYARLSEQHSGVFGLDEATRRQLEGLGYL